MPGGNPEVWEASVGALVVWVGSAGVYVETAWGEAVQTAEVSAGFVGTERRVWGTLEEAERAASTAAVGRPMKVWVRSEEAAG